MNSFNALEAFSKQLERHIGGDSFHTKVVVTPSTINEKGVVIKVSLLKTYTETKPAVARFTRIMRVRVSVAGSAKSLTGLSQAIEAIEAIDRYLSKDNLRLESFTDEGIPNSRIIQQISAEDSFFDSPDSITEQHVQDDRIVTITFQEGADNESVRN